MQSAKKQQSTRPKSPSKHKNNTKPKRPIFSSSNVAILAFAIPIIAWFIASRLNETGWMSHWSDLAFIEFTSILIPILACASGLYFFLFVLKINYDYKFNMQKILKIIAILTSIIYSYYLFFATVNASSEEPE